MVPNSVVPFIPFSQTLPMTAEDYLNLQTEYQIFTAQSSKNYLFSMYWVIVGLLSKFLVRTIPFIRLNPKTLDLFSISIKE